MILRSVRIASLAQRRFARLAGGLCALGMRDSVVSVAGKSVRVAPSRRGLWARRHSVPPVRINRVRERLFHTLKSSNGTPLFKNRFLFGNVLGVFSGFNREYCLGHDFLIP